MPAPQRKLHVLAAPAFCLLASLIFPLTARAGTFDGRRAMDDIRAQCAFGPRIPGTEGHAKCAAWIAAEIEKAGLVAWEQPFTAHLALTDTEVEARNIWGLPPSLAAVHPEDSSAEAAAKEDSSAEAAAKEDSSAEAAAKEDGGSTETLIVLSAHWDTRPLADNEPPGAEQQPFLGANDGASGVAMALELARAFADTDLANRIVLVFFDAEDAGVQGRPETWILGSQHAAAHLPAWFDRVELGINLDMVAARNLELKRERNSLNAAPEAMTRLWRLGARTAPTVFVNGAIGPYTDDHVPFIEAGVRYIDLLGLPWAHWHRLNDTPEQCSWRTLRRVGRVVQEFVRMELED